MKALIASAIILCGPVTLVNDTDQPWNNKDKETFDRAYKRCEEIYKTAPCLKYFGKKYVIDIKKNKHVHYSAVCGMKQINKYTMGL